MKKALLIFLSCLLVTSSFASDVEEKNVLDDLNPKAKNIEEILKKYDREYERATGKSPFIETTIDKSFDCFRISCGIWAQVSLTQQKMNVYIDGTLSYTWKVSSGMTGFSTPSMDRHPNGRLYDAYTSTTFPEGDYNGLGNMPYAVFIQGGYAIHGTTTGNWKRLGTVASHGCIRLHPDNAQIFLEYVRTYGIGNVWITVQR